jgi:septal ring factor EnvC (AmiA/AmiB activator)
MNIDSTTIVLSICAAMVSGMGTAIISGISSNKKEKIRRQERDQDQLKLELKDLKIELYKIERDLVEWKDKYYAAIQDLIAVKADLEEALIQLTFVEVCHTPTE